jgi:phosphohistidine phosphatase
MKQIILLRHAEAVERAAELPDFERSLVKCGEKDAKRMGMKLKEACGGIGLIVSSPANRALETAHIVAKTIEYPLQRILLKDAIYDSTSAHTLLEMIRELNNEHDTVLICGHDPVISELAVVLSTDVNRNIPKAGVVGIAFENGSWKEIEPAAGRLIYFFHPNLKKERAQQRKASRKELEGKLVSAVRQVLEELHPDGWEKVRKKTEKLSRQLSRRFFKALDSFSTTTTDTLALSSMESAVPSAEAVHGSEATDMAHTGDVQAMSEGTITSMPMGFPPGDTAAIEDITASGGYSVATATPETSDPQGVIEPPGPAEAADDASEKTSGRAPKKS